MPTDSNGTSTFGDGSNRWIPGAREFLSDPGQAVRDPYDTVAGAADAAALNFDEGVGGLASLFDNESGNTAGPGQSPWLAEPQDADEWDGPGAQPGNPGTTGVPWLDGLYKVALIVGAGYALLLLAQVVGPMLDLLVNLTED